MTGRGVDARLTARMQSSTEAGSSDARAALGQHQAEIRRLHRLRRPGHFLFRTGQQSGGSRRRPMTSAPSPTCFTTAPPGGSGRMELQQHAVSRSCPSGPSMDGPGEQIQSPARRRSRQRQHASGRARLRQRIRSGPGSGIRTTGSRSARQHREPAAPRPVNGTTPPAVGAWSAAPAPIDASNSHHHPCRRRLLQSVVSQPDLSLTRMAPPMARAISNTSSTTAPGPSTPDPSVCRPEPRSPRKTSAPISRSMRTAPRPRRVTSHLSRAFTGNRRGQMEPQHGPVRS